jgi:hypothetical protein
MGKITKLERKIAEVATIISDVACEDPEFLHAVLCQVSLPRNPSKERTFVRTSGNVSVQIKAGDYFDGLKWIPQSLPSGTRPRLVLIHACSEAIRTQSPHVQIGESVSEFLRQLKIDTDGRTMKYFRREMMALSVCEMTFAWKSGDEVVQTKAPPIRTFHAWMVDDGKQRCLWPGQMKLDNEFFETLLAHAVPLDPRAIGALKGSSLAIDTYAWLAHRLCRIRTPKGVMLSWQNLHDQFGAEYASVKKFKQSFLHALRQAHAVYKHAKIEQVRGGLLLQSSPPPIARKSVVVALPAPPKPAALPRRYVSEDALDQVRKIAPGWDRQYLLARYMDWIEGKEPPRDIDRAFLGWAKKFTKGKPPA